MGAEKVERREDAALVEVVVAGQPPPVRGAEAVKVLAERDEAEHGAEQEQLRLRAMAEEEGEEEEG